MHLTVESIITAMAVKLGYEPELPPEYVTVAEAATVLGVKVGTLAKWRSTGQHGLPYIKRGRVISYRLADLAKHSIGHVFAHPDCKAGHIIRD